MQVQQLLNNAAAALAGAGIVESRQEAELLLQTCLGLSKSGLFLLQDEQLTSVQERRFQEFLLRRCNREPLQYIAGICEFWSLEFTVNPAVLIPRPETEFLLDHVLTTLATEANGHPEKILDLCTGSGVIGIVLAKELEQAAVTAVDYSLDALVVASKNVTRHGLEERVQLIAADLFTCFRPDHAFDLIVSNPPYVKSGDLAGLEPEVRDWEPELALTGGLDGLAVIDLICLACLDHLQPAGWLFMEIGADISDQVVKVFTGIGGYQQVKIIDDWSGRPRVLQARRKQQINR
jgi:release factor glutamine methyltransferase